MKTLEDIRAHMFCLYFAPGLTQNGEFDEGIDGFLLPDIRKELKRGTHLKCSYCGQKGAVVGCLVPSCHLNYHLPCGIQNGVYNNFHEDGHSYPSHCVKHRPRGLVVPRFTGKRLCTICQEDVKYSQKDDLLHFSCCNSYFHRDCIAQLAYHQAGPDLLKCPNCKNDAEFVEKVKRSGIYVPTQQPVALGNTTNTAAASLVSSPPTSTVPGPEDVTFQCCMEDCKCEQGRSFNGENEWELFACDRCGSDAVHVACAGLHDGAEWICSVCINV